MVAHVILVLALRPNPFFLLGTFLDLGVKWDRGATEKNVGQCFCVKLLIHSLTLFSDESLKAELIT